MIRSNTLLRISYCTDDAGEKTTKSMITDFCFVFLKS